MRLFCFFYDNFWWNWEVVAAELANSVSSGPQSAISYTICLIRQLFTELGTRQQSPPWFRDVTLMISGDALSLIRA